MQIQKKVIIELFGSVGLACMILACVAVSDQSAYSFVGGENNGFQDSPCANIPMCHLKGVEKDICGNANDKGTSGGGRCDEDQVVCVCQPSVGSKCVCSK